MKNRIAISVVGAILFIAPTLLSASISENYQIELLVINGGGNTYTGTSQKQFDVLGEAIIGQSYGDQYSVQAVGSDSDQVN